MADDTATGLSDAARAELLDRATERGFVLTSELADLHDRLVHADADVDDLADEADALGLDVVDDRAEAEYGGPVGPAGYSTDPVRQYLNEAGRYELLDAEQEQDLAKRYRAARAATGMLAEGGLSGPAAARLRRLAADGTRARERLIRTNLRLVVPTARKYAGRDLPMNAAIQEGNLGLIRAVEKFDHRKGYKFSTYAVWWIRQALQRGLSSRGRTVRVPSTIWEDAGRIRRGEARARMRLGREPTVEETAEAADLEPERVHEVRAALRPLASLDLPVGEDGDVSLGDLLPDTQVAGPEHETTVADLRARLVETLTTLPERERAVIELRFGLRDGETRTLREVGDAVGLSGERVRQLEKDALEMLRDPAAVQGLHDVFDALAA